jgi:uncharacterized membrane protein
MELQLLIGFLLVLFPITGLRVGIPMIVDYSIKNNLGIFIIILFFFIAILLSFFMAMLLYFFLEFVHEHFLKIKIYSRVFNKFLQKIRKKNERFEKKYKDIGYLALLIYISIPIPGSGVWAGTFLSWFLGLEKRKAIPIIAMGLFIYGLLILLMTLGFFGFFYR